MMFLSGLGGGAVAVYAANSLSFSGFVLQGAAFVGACIGIWAGLETGVHDLSQFGSKQLKPRLNLYPALTYRHLRID